MPPPRVSLQRSSANSSIVLVLLPDRKHAPLCLHGSKLGTIADVVTRHWDMSVPKRSSGNINRTNYNNRGQCPLNFPSTKMGEDYSCKSLYLFHPCSW